MGMKFSVILANKAEVELMKSLCSKYNAPVSIKRYSDHYEFELVTDVMTARTIDNEFEKSMED